MERQLTDIERAQVESSREPGERVRRRGQYQAGIVVERTADAVLVWWGTSDRKRVVTWEKAGNVVAWTGKEKAPSTTAPLKEIDLRDVPAAPARKVKAPVAKAVAKKTPRGNGHSGRNGGNGGGRNGGGRNGGAG
jgi:uncharacterized membrane protein YgcG